MSVYRNSTKHQHGISPPNRWAIGKDQSMVRTISQDICQPLTGQLGKMATNHTICTQCLAQFNNKATPFELIMGYTPRTHQVKNTQKLPTLQDHIKHVRHIRQEAQIAIQHAQELMTKAKGTLRQYRPFSQGQKVWLEGKNLSTTHPMAKLAPK